MRALRILLLAFVSLPVAACGGEEGPSKDDARTVQAMLRSSVAVQRAVQPLYFCLPEQPECYRQTGPAIVEVTDRERQRMDVALENTDDACLEEVARLYRSSLDEYGKVGRAATSADVAAVDEALAKTTDQEISYTEKLGACGFVEGDLARAGTKFRETSVAMLRLDQEFTACQDEGCVIELAGRGRELAAGAIADVDAIIAEVEKGNEDVPACFSASLGGFKDAFRALSRTMAALERLDVEAAEREAQQAGVLQSEAQEDLADCLGAAIP